ncbi:bifunctional diguanylate cyclase/phosphodiesterase [Brenneria roseae subsp. americana]|uniref:diguanylate cyclase n=1 Tax=Brenneria roseae subsp. americana TaxID=1508507 RepID=A0A2U1TXU9_9GAMM|nr:EAL domain-containing protein [Brenneria roseae]PWC14182.1 bifunctional diguanylate cyclase/phosphodiesterase [Brenneria roseae subsp. americana]
MHTAINSSRFDVFRQVVEQSVDAKVVIDENGQIVFFNSAAEALWGERREDVLGRKVSLLMPDMHPSPTCSQLDEHFVRVLRAMAGTYRDISINLMDGAGIKTIEIGLSRINTAERVFYLAIARDVSVARRQEEERRLLSRALNESESAIYITDADWHITYLNDGFTRMLGYTLATAQGKNPPQLLSPQSTSAHNAAVWELFRQGKPFRGNQLLYRRDGRRLWGHIMETPIHDDQGNISHIVGVLTDITQAQMYQSLHQQVLEDLVREQPLELVMEQMCRLIESILPDTIASIIRVDEQQCLRALAAPSLPVEYIHSFDGLPIGPLVGSCGTAAFLNESVVVTDIAQDPRWETCRDQALELGLRACWSSPIRSGDGRVIGTFAFYFSQCREPDILHREIADICTHLCALALEREDARRDIRQLAFFDTLTGLPNRNLLLAQADRMIEEVAREGSPLAVLFIDLDHFKAINDAYGHATGDELLRTIADRVRQVAQASDIVGRLSGDEFVIVLPHCGEEQVVEILERLRGAISQPCQLAGITVTPQSSIGISLYPHDGNDMTTLLLHADLAMYQAKRTSRGGLSFYNKEMNIVARERMTMEHELRLALANKSLSLAWQPQVRLRDGELSGVEVLARWYHPELGYIPPTRFIPLAEECGLIHQLSDWVLDTACQQLVHWRNVGIFVPVISVNLSPASFHNPDLPAALFRTLERYGLKATDLVIEITENILLDNHPNILTSITAIHRSGIQLSIDDFGTGYSSLGYLRRLPISELKLDKSFVDDLEHDAASRALSKAVVGIGEGLDLRLVAEGIERRGQLEILQEHGYQSGQGYLFSKPLPASAFETWVAEYSAKPGGVQSDE